MVTVEKTECVDTTMMCTASCRKYPQICPKRSKISPKSAKMWPIFSQNSVPTWSWPWRCRSRRCWCGPPRRSSPSAWSCRTYPPACSDRSSSASSGLRICNDIVSESRGGQRGETAKGGGTGALGRRRLGLRAVVMVVAEGRFVLRVARAHVGRPAPCTASQHSRAEVCFSSRRTRWVSNAEGKWRGGRGGLPMKKMT